jgi:hypothetical protein
MIDPSAFDLLAPTGVPSFKFASIGDTVKGLVVAAESRQQTDLDGNLKSWDDGKPMMQLVITLATDLRDPHIEDDNGHRRIFVKGEMLKAIKEVVGSESNKVTLEVGTDLAVKYIGDGEPTKKGYNAPKLFKAHAKAAAPVADLDF